MKFHNQTDRTTKRGIDGYRLDELLEFLTDAQAHGAPPGAEVTIDNRAGYESRPLWYAKIRWTEDR